MAADDGDRFFHIIELAAALFEDGAPVVAARTLVGGMAEMSRLERRLSCHVLRAGIRQAGRWTGSERAAVRAELNRLPASGSLASEHRTLISLLDAAPPREPGTPVIGRANVLVTARDDGVGQYGRVVHLDVFVRPGGGSIRFEQAGDDLAQFRGFYQGVLAAEEYLLRRTRGSLAAALYLRAGSVRGLVPVLRRGSRLSGASLGLSTAMAALSAFLNLGLPEDVAFTGGVDPRGRVDPVGDVAVKLQAAKERGIGRVYIPSGNADAVTGLDGPDLDVVTVATVDDVASQAWTSGEMERSLGRQGRSLRGIPGCRGRGRVHGGGGRGSDPHALPDPPAGRRLFVPHECSRPVERFHRPGGRSRARDRRDAARSDGPPPAAAGGARSQRLRPAGTRPSPGGLRHRGRGVPGGGSDGVCRQLVLRIAPDGNDVAPAQGLARHPCTSLPSARGAVCRRGRGARARGRAAGVHVSEAGTRIARVRYRRSAAREREAACHGERAVAR